MTRTADLAEQLADLAQRRGLTVAAAESLTGGAVSSAMAAGPEASEWYRGAVVAYSPGVKFEVLGVTPGPLVTARCAEELSTGVARLLGATAAVSTTGVGGPDPEEGEEPGTLYIGVTVPDGTSTYRVELDGPPEEVVERSTERALELLIEALKE